MFWLGAEAALQSTEHSSLVHFKENIYLSILKTVVILIFNTSAQKLYILVLVLKISN